MVAPQGFSFFSMKLTYTTDQLLTIVPDGRLEGGFDGPVGGLSTLRDALAGDLSFLGNTRYRNEVASSRASVILVPEDFAGAPAAGQAFIRCPDPSVGLARICADIERKLWPAAEPGIHPSAVIEDGARVDTGASVGPFCWIGPGASVGPGAVLVSHVSLGRESVVGAHSRLMPQVTVTDFCRVGSQVILHSGVVIGSDGFGFVLQAGRHEKVPQVGNVVVEDLVEIGANTTVDRARFASTVIGEGSKIDNLVQIAHNVRIGRHCLIVSQVGISGSTTLGDYVVIGGQTGLAGHLEIGDRCRIGGRSGVSKNLPAGSFVAGTPAFEFYAHQRVTALQKRLPEFFERLSALERHTHSGEKPVQPSA